MAGRLHDRRSRPMLESLEGRATPSAMPVPPMPPQPVDAVVFVGPILPTIVLPIEIPADIQQETPRTPHKPVENNAVLETAAPANPAAIAGALRDAAFRMQTAISPTLPTAEALARSHAEELPPLAEAHFNHGMATSEELAAVVGRLGIAAEPSPGEMVFDWAAPTHTAAFWQRPAMAPESEPEAVRDGERPAAVPEVEARPPIIIPPVMPPASPMPPANETPPPSNESRETESDDSVAVKRSETRLSLPGAASAGVLFFGWIKKPRRSRSRSASRGPPTAKAI